jgi:DNA-binding protein HU-beta
MARSGLKKVVKTVKGKKGTVRRSYWVKAQGAAGKAKKAEARKAPAKKKAPARKAPAKKAPAKKKAPKRKTR